MNKLFCKKRGAKYVYLLGGSNGEKTPTQKMIEQKLTYFLKSALGLWVWAAENASEKLNQIPLNLRRFESHNIVAAQANVHW